MLRQLRLWYLRRQKRSLFSAPTSRAGVPDGAFPDVDALMRDSRQEAIDEAFANLRVSVPRLRSDTEDSCPCPREAVGGYVGLEEGTPPSALTFVRTGQVLDTCWWLWQYRSPAGSPAFVTVGLLDVPITGALGADATWTSDQVIFYDFMRTIHALRRELVRASDGSVSIVPRSGR